MLWLQGIMGAGLASSLAGNRILNGCLLAPSHRPTHTRTLPPCVSSPRPHSDSSHTLYYSELHQSSSGVSACAPRGHTMDHLNDFGGLELQTSFFIDFLTPLALVALDIVRKGTSLHRDCSYFIFLFLFFKTCHRHQHRD